jgi:hypothetical protein
MSRLIENRLWGRATVTADDTKCWIWLGCTAKGYGRISFQGRTRNAHCVAYFLRNGKWPLPMGRHTCDNKKCINPAHVISGTHIQNMQDMRDRGRQAKGETKNTAKLTSRQVIEIRRLGGQGVSRRELAARFRTHKDNIRLIVLRETWQHI